MVAESRRGLFTLASMRNTVSNITDSVRRGLNRLDTFYNPSISQEEEKTAMIAKCLYYGPTKKTFDWLTKFEDKESFGFGLVKRYNQIQLHQLNSMTHGITKAKNNENYGETLFEKNLLAIAPFTFFDLP